MKTALTFGLTLCLPIILSAQQKGTTLQDLQRQMNEMKQEMQTQISLLHDSIISLQKQLKQQQAEKDGGYEFFYQNPFPGERDFTEIPQRHSWNFEFPHVPDENFHMLIPLPGDDYYFDLKHLQVPRCPEPPKEKHKHEWMKMLPFGNLFKN